MPVTKNIFIFGDSITYGEWDSKGGWANRIRCHLDALVLPKPDDYIISYNLGIPSDTSTGLAQRLEAETRARLDPNPSVKTIQIIIAVGANDARWLTDEARRGVNAEQFKINLTSITQAAQRHSSDIIFVGLLPCDEQQALQSATKHGWIETFDNDSLMKYNSIVEQHCLENKLKFVNVYELFINNNPEQLLSDGLHPNNKGHALIFDALLKQL